MVQIRRCDVCDNVITPSGTYYRYIEEDVDQDGGLMSYPFTEEFDSIECLTKSITEMLLLQGSVSITYWIRIEKIVTESSSISLDSLLDK